MRTQLAKDVRNYPNARYDHTCRKFAANRQILTRIFQNAVPGFMESSLEEINRLLSIPHPPGSVPIDRGERLRTEESGDYDEQEGRMEFDLVVSARQPGRKKKELRVDLEVQNSFYLRRLRGRIFAYLGRLFSMQKGVIYEDDEYEKQQKVVEIWIITNPPKKYRNKILYYPPLASEKTLSEAE